MELINIIYLYAFISGIVLFTTALASMHAMQPDEIENFYDWLFYGLLWILVVIKYLIKFLWKLIKK